MTKQNKLYQAMMTVQQEAPFIDKSEDNPFFKSKYADLPQIWRSIKEIMCKNNLLVTHTMSVNEDEYITTKIIHVDSGESIESTSKIQLSKVTAQEYGSYITYMRRYALSAMLGLVTDEDDDGNSATKAQEKSPPKKASPKKPDVPRLSAEEMADLIQRISGATTLDELKYAWELVNGAKARMSDADYKGLADQKEAKKGELNA